MTILPILIFDNDLQRGDIIKFNDDELMVCDERCFWTENPCLLNLKDTDTLSFLARCYQAKRDLSWTRSN